MSKLKLHAALRMLAYSVLIILLCAMLALLVANLRSMRDIRLQLSSTDDRIAGIAQETETQIHSLAQELKELLNGMQKEIASTRGSTRGDVSRMGTRLSNRLDEMARRMKDIAAGPQSASSVPAPFANVKPAQAVTTAPESSAALPAAAATPAAFPVATLSSRSTPPASTDLDMSAARRMKEGEAFFDSGRYGQAQKSFLAAVGAQPDNVNARLYYAASLYRANPADETSHALIEKNLRSVLSSDGENLLALEILAMVELERQKWPEALEHLKLLIALQPGNTGHLKTAGYCSLKIEDPQAARSYFESASRQSPGDEEALSTLGDCESRLGNPEAAEQDWKAALSILDSGTATGARASLELYIKLAKSAYGRGAYEYCLAQAKEGERHGSSPVLRAYEGLSISAAGSKEEGKAILQEVSASSNAQAAALAGEGLREGQQ